MIDHLREPPYRLCCGHQHWGPVCPDGKVMCSLCFARFEKEDLHTQANGTKEDVCRKCHDSETELIKAVGKCICMECSGCSEGWCDRCTPDIDSVGHSRACPLRELA